MNTITQNKDYFMVKNFFNYEKIIPPPINLPKNLITVYVTDSVENEEMAKKMGWQIVKKITENLNITDKFERRKLVGFVNSFPTKVVPEIQNARYIFICDSNVVNLWNNYNDFINKCTENFALFFTSGYYKGERDTIDMETNISYNVHRWAYNKEEIKKSSERYKKILSENNIDYNSLSIVSAKYIGWNIKHEMYSELSNLLYNEYSVNLQGNIILTFMSGIFKNHIFNYYTNDYSGAKLNEHNFES
jgi:urocanate hydratase